MSMLKDKLHRPLHDLRISVTDRCNFRCQYCMPAEIFGPDYPFLRKQEVLSFEEIERIASIFANLGVKKLRITGGEPLMRKDIPILIKKLHEIKGITDIGMTTNGVLLPKYAKDLYDAGLRRLNISLDALDNTIFQKMNGRGVRSEAVLKGIESARQAGFSIKVNMVVQKGVNDSQIIPMVTYFRNLDVTLRFIEFMDVGTTNGWNWEQVVTKREIFELLSKHFQLEPVEQSYFGEVAKRYKHKDTNAEIGFITSVSESFCSSCTRARISADGKFYTCLFAGNGHDLRALVRSEANNQQIEERISHIWSGRTDRYSDERTEGKPIDKKKIEMSYIGG
ncbi:GTP 3',8-cyclase MoaA [Bacillus sp. FJAT-50079]|uniref:GTP 3',8-cyclase MoaA n=1 Tax=Bacillus sp. FJAT-50079 TaxID=2833577 RepID=UPI001BC9FDAD|nr:GTP 3',8-cyclase MoaA [Bacillus sp. FJAT-50079]MBS4209893.1 GTP 3',8-cyclase MoaA [Bacillus sp. FJAT-50079]